MDPFTVLGITASVIACIQLTGALLGRLGPSSHDRSALNRLLMILNSFKGAYEGIKLFQQFNEHDEARSSILNNLEGPLTESKAALDLVQERLKRVSFIGQHLIGNCWDKKLKHCLQRLEDARAVFELTMHADHHTILRAIETYVRSSAEDIRDCKSILNHNGKRLLELGENSRTQHQNIGIWHDRTDNQIRNLDEAISAHLSETKRHCSEFSSCLNGLAGSLQDSKTEMERTVLEQNKTQILRWLSNTNPSFDHAIARSNCQPATGSWFLQRDEYLTWRTSPGSFLFLQGIPGCGKTVLCSTIIEKLQQHCTENPSHALAYYYISFNDTEKQIAVNLLRSVVAQLLLSMPVTHSQYFQILQQFQSGAIEHKLFSALKDIFRSVVDLAQDTYIIIDAIDEISSHSGQRDRLCDLLLEFAGLRDLHILVTGRGAQDIKDSLTRIPSMSEIWIHGSMEADIELFIDKRLRSDVKLNRWPHEIKENIKKRLVKGANGMFQWVVCQLTILRSCLSTNAVKTALDSLPRTLDRTYERILSGIDEEHRILATRALNWLVMSARPLQVTELAEAVILRREGCIVRKEDRFLDPRGILLVLSSLIVTSMQPKPLRRSQSQRLSLSGVQDDGGSDDGASEVSDDSNDDRNDHPQPRERPMIETVRLAHLSVKEYLLSERAQTGSASMFAVLKPDSHELITDHCLRYIKHYDKIMSKSAIADIVEESPLINYACNFWPNHARECHTQHILRMIGDFLTSKTLLCRWKSVCQPRRFWATHEDAPPQHNASYLGLTRVSEYLPVPNSRALFLAGGSALRPGQHSQYLNPPAFNIIPNREMYGNPLTQAITSGWQSLLQTINSRSASPSPDNTVAIREDMAAKQALFERARARGEGFQPSQELSITYSPRLNRLNVRDTRSISEMQVVFRQDSGRLSQLRQAQAFYASMLHYFLQNYVDEPHYANFNCTHSPSILDGKSLFLYEFRILSPQKKTLLLQGERTE